MFTGELISLGVAFSWTLTALCFEYASKQMGVIALNVLRLGLAILMLGLTLCFFTGHFFPAGVAPKAWFWLGVSGFVGYVLGDYCLFSSYVVIGSRFGQLFMTLAPPSAALAGWLILGERMSWSALLGMIVTLTGIGLSVVGKREEGSGHWQVKLPLKGILFGIGAGLGQGFGIVFSKLGMEYYTAGMQGADSTALFLVPFASTQIRALVGVTGFSILLFLSGKGKALLHAFKEKKTMGSALAGTVFGPFIGVSFSLMAVQYTEAGIASTLMALTPVMILAPSFYFFHQKIRVQEVVGALISVLGVALFFVG
ncbi:MAG: DMT family transporter [Tannerella sp.]|jgi:drug/metabolite transporter (DMT)-like permease|nr:DMT family transporter [Tannerella sp.]